VGSAPRRLCAPRLGGLRAPSAQSGPLARLRVPRPGVPGRMIAVLRVGDPRIAYALMARRDPIPELKRAAASALAKRIRAWPSAYDAAVLLGTQRARVVDIRSGRLDRFSLETLLRYLVRAGASVELRVTDGGVRGASRAQLVDGE
jgi:hypothetical protein